MTEITVYTLFTEASFGWIHLTQSTEYKESITLLAFSETREAVVRDHLSRERSRWLP